MGKLHKILLCVGITASTVIYPTIIHEAAKYGDYATVQQMLKDQSYDTFSRDALLHTAVMNGRENITELLLHHGANPNASNNRNLPPLHQAAFENYENIVCLLLQYDADPNAQDKNGCTPLNFAAKNGHENIAHLLLQCGANPNIQDTDDETPIYDALEEHHEKVVRLLLQYGAIVDKPQVIIAFTGARSTPELTYLLNHAASIQNGTLFNSLQAYILQYGETAPTEWRYMRDNQLHTEYAKIALGYGNVDTVQQILEDAKKCYYNGITSIYAEVLLHGEILKAASRATHNVNAYIDDLQQDPQTVDSMLHKTCDRLNYDTIAPHIFRYILEQYGDYIDSHFGHIAETESLRIHRILRDMICGKSISNVAHRIRHKHVTPVEMNALMTHCRQYIAGYQDQQTGNTLLHDVARIPSVASYVPEIARLVMANPRQRARNRNNETVIMIAHDNSNIVCTQILNEYIGIISVLSLYRHLEHFSYDNIWDIIENNHKTYRQ